MYPLPAVRPAWDALWGAVHRTAPWTPSTLRWTDDVHATWRDPACLVGQACGWPVAALLRDAVRVVGAFTLAIPGANGHRYRSVLVGRDDRPLAALAGDGAVVAANSADSLSGWISLLAAAREAGVPPGEWPDEVVWTGAHIESLRALQNGRVEAACIDALTLAQIDRHHPELVDGLHRIGHGPLIPSPPVVMPAQSAPALVESLRDALTWATADPELAAECAAIGIDGFVALDGVEYDPLLELVADG
jgi:ABC-type phosphate/phosphonate transport system substrate-binding protein